ncbi:MAG: LacI family DNA-binding transcriptional regulator [Candidatus Woesearchaeota archaeon]
MVTIKDVAKKANVSVATVSAVMNVDSDVNVSDELIHRVNKAIEELNYRPNRIARALSKKKTSVIAYVVPSIENRFFSQMGHLIEDYVYKNNYAVYLCNTHCKIDRAKLYMNNLIENQIAGAVITLTWEVLQTNFIENLIENDIPVVGLAGARTTNIIDTVTIDDIKGTELAIEYFLKKGYKNIGFIGVQSSKTTEKRLKGYKNALKKVKVSFDKNKIALGNDFNRKDGYLLTKKLIKKNTNLQSIFVYNDVMAAGVIDQLKELKIKVPQEIEIIGYDDSVSEFIHPKLSTMAINKKEMVNYSMKILFDRIENKNYHVKSEKVLPTLILRETTS